MSAGGEQGPLFVIDVVIDSLVQAGHRSGGPIFGLQSNHAVADFPALQVFSFPPPCAGSQADPRDALSIRVGLELLEECEQLLLV